MKRKSEKATHSFFGNLLFMFKTITHYDKILVPLNLGFDVFSAIGNLALVSFSTALTYCIEKGKSFPLFVAVISGIVLLQLAVHISGSLMWQSIETRRADVGRRFEVLLGHKLMNMDFFLIEGPLGREKYQKAKNALCEEGVYGFLEQYGKLFTFILLTIFFTVATAALNPWLVLILSALEALKLVFAALENKLIGKIKDPIAKADRRINYLNRVSRDFSFAKDIRLFHMREYLTKLCEEYIIARKRLTEKMYFYYFCTDLMSLVLSVLIEIGIFGYIIYSGVKGNISVTELVFFSFTVTEFAAYISAVGEKILGAFQINIGINDFREFLDIENVQRNSGGKALPEKTPYEIELKNVSFTYPGSDKRILDCVNLKIKAGESLALVGVNGAGKTTLVKIICGLYMPTEGEVLINGTDISEFNRDDYYKAISAVFQGPRFLPCTVFENVSMLRESESDRKRFFKSVKKAGLYEKIMSLPEKENTLLVKTVNENAVELSGGEMQRLLLARAVYKNAPVLVLDEPTAALDPIAENEIYLKYNDISKDKTSVYISHRLSSTRFCDRIVLLSDGKIAEEGTHEELMALKGKYADMFDIQSKYYKKGEKKNE